MKKILITGANSYIGVSFEKYMEKFGDEYSVDTADMIGDEWKNKDFSTYSVVFHVAAVVHKKETKDLVSQYYAVNRDLAAEVAEKSKLQAEQKLLPMNDDAFKVCVLRPPMIYGKGCKGNYRALEKFAGKLHFFPYVANERSMLYVDNLAAFVKLMIDKDESGVFFPQNDEYTNTSLMVKSIAAARGRKMRLVKGFTPLIRFLGLFTGLVNKAFGNLTYDKSLSYPDFKPEFGLEESIVLSET